ncbi:MAG: zinc transport system permease protein [Verrucomicrobiales bacterium]|jgi:zinc transport system permease protein
MVEYFNDLAANSFLRYSLIAGLIASVSFGVVGTYVVARRITYIAGAVAHCALGGIGVALYAQKVLGWEWCDPIYGALAVSVSAALVIGWVTLRGSEREDTIIGALWATGMAIGFLFIQKIPGTVSTTTWLFGDINIVSSTDVWLASILAVVVITLAYLYHKQFVAISFDEEFARVRGVRVSLFYLLLLCLTAVTVVILVRIVGIIMVIALLTLPSAIASRLGRGFFQIMLIATILCMMFITSGLAISYSAETVTGPTIILIAAVAYFVSLLLPRRATK